MQRYIKYLKYKHSSRFFCRDAPRGVFKLKSVICMDLLHVCPVETPRGASSFFPRHL